MSLGGSSKGGGAGASGASSTEFDVTGGGTNAPWTWGISPFDQSAIDTATGQNASSIGARYNQLGLGGSTMEGQDQGAIPTATGGNVGQGQAVTGSEQNTNVGQPALNPALQPQFNSTIGGQPANTSASSLGSLAGLAGKALGGLGGGTAAAAGTDAATTDALSTLGPDVAEGLAILG
ncbi:MAG TPA: hypothetical protein VHT52_01720 [Stellaceae bacterium]|jgi:hypothetical protein|nr:hypothetical protein [Stellaceae bacterium]